MNADEFLDQRDAALQAADDRRKLARYEKALRTIASMDKHSGASLRARAASEVARSALAERS